MYGRNRLMILTLSILALVGVMAVSAPVAQGWVVREGGSSTLDVQATGLFTLGQLYVPDLKLKFHCSSGLFGSALVQTDHKTWSVTTSGAWSSCDVVGAEKTCSVNSPGEADGTITWKGAGQGVMEGSKTYAKLESGNFSEIEIQGLCAAAETEEVLSGSMTLTFQNPESELETHGLELDEASLQFGEDEALLSNSSGTGAIQGSAKTVSGNKWSISLN